MRSDINEIAYQYFNDLLHEAKMKVHDHSLYYGYWFQLENGSWRNRRNRKDNELNVRSEEEEEPIHLFFPYIYIDIEIYEYILTRLEKI